MKNSHIVTPNTSFIGKRAIVFILFLCIQIFKIMSWFTNYLQRRLIGFLRDKQLHELLHLHILNVLNTLMLLSLLIRKFYVFGYQESLHVGF